MSTGDAPPRLTAPARNDAASASAGGLSARIAAHPEAIAIGLGVALITALNMLWVSRETRPPHWDEARHLLNSLVYRDTLAAGHVGGAITDYHTYPPLVYWVADAFYGVFGTTDAWAATLSQSVFLAVLAASTYALGRDLWSRRVGLLATVFVLTSPIFVSQFKDFMIDAPLTAMTALGLYLLVRSKEFSRRGASVALGAACGFGLLTKWNFALYVALPVGVAVVRIAFAKRRGARLLNLGLAAATTAAISAAWYVANVAEAYRDTTGNTEAAKIEGDPAIGSIAGVTWYLWNLLSNQLFLIPFLLFAAGVVLLAFRPEARRKNLYPALLVLSTYVAYTALVNKDDRYTLPMLPGVAVLATYWFDSLAATARRWASAGLIAYGAVTFAAISFGIGFLPGDVFVNLGKSCRSWPYHVGPCEGLGVVSATQTFERFGVRNVRGIRIWSQGGFIDGPPSGEQWRQEEMFREAARRSRTRTVYLASSGFDFIWFNSFAMQYFGEKYGITWVATPQQGDFAAVWDRPGEHLAAPEGFSPYRRHRLPDGGSLTLLTRDAAIIGAPGKTGIASVARRLGHPVYWVGKRPGTTIQVHESGSNVYVRYVPDGVATTEPVLTIGTYALPDAFEATSRAASDPTAVHLDAGAGTVAFYSAARPESVYLASPGSPVEVEVFDPDPKRARSLVVSGAVRPVG